MAVPTIKFPFPHDDSNSAPIEWAGSFRRVEENEIQQLIEATANFYAHFFSPSCERDEKIFCNKPTDFPTNEAVTRFKEKFIQLVTEKMGERRNKSIWDHAFSTHYHPEGLLGSACKEIGEEFQHNLGVFFPNKSQLWFRLNCEAKQLTVEWKGKRVW